MRLRRSLGRVILVGLEVLIIGEIVVIRIVVSFALQVEIDGRWPSREHEAESVPRLRTWSGASRSRRWR